MTSCFQRGRPLLPLNNIISVTYRLIQQVDLIFRFGPQVNSDLDNGHRRQSSLVPCPAQIVNSEKNLHGNNF